LHSIMSLSVSLSRILSRNEKIQYHIRMLF